MDGASDDWTVRLEPFEIAFAADVGVRRHIMALSRRSNDAFGYNRDDGWADHIEGACGEMAVAKKTGRYWPASVGTYDTGDDVAGLQVRTRSKHDYELIIRERDANDKIFVLVTGKAPVFTIRGWIEAREGKSDAHWKDYGGRSFAWFVPQGLLHPMWGLPENFLSSVP